MLSELSLEEGYGEGANYLIGGVLASSLPMWRDRSLSLDVELASRSPQNAFQWLLDEDVPLAETVVSEEDIQTIQKIGEVSK